MTATTVLVVPAYNEAARLDRAAFMAFVNTAGSPRLLFVNDGSSDATGEVLSGMAAVSLRIGVLTLERNSGKAEAVRRGVLAAFDMGADVIGYWDADLATPLTAATELEAELDRWPETLLVMGSRVRLLGRTISRHAARHYLGRVFSTAASLVLGLGAYDTQCGAKLFRASAEMRDCFARPFNSRWIFDVELLTRVADSVAMRGAAPERSIREFPLAEWRDLGSSRLSAADFARAPLELLRIYWHRPRRGLRRNSALPSVSGRRS